LTEREAALAVIGECAADGYYRRRCCRSPSALLDRGAGGTDGNRDVVRI